MLNHDEIIELLIELSTRRPVFHSEKDFQHAIAWLIQEKHPDWSVRLEYPIQDIGAIDILLRHSEDQFLLELKYKTSAGFHEIDGEVFRLKNHGAHPLNRYDGLKDVERIQKSSLCGATIFLTNDLSYWKQDGDNGDQFSLASGRVTDPGTILKWNRPDEPLAKKRPSPICLNSRYEFRWSDYSGHPLGFKFLLLMIGI